MFEGVLALNFVSLLLELRVMIYDPVKTIAFNTNQTILRELQNVFENIDKVSE